ncbi:hypothetical protein I204_05944 [Kwoniella mangroviensis CBS 8886]|uniref:uncharacterized protein n=1 Tax=Kwoniella mangroviensis CBS 8507 TaxID=1296122 RepID=UPI00080D59CD|nr:uncharacterized protein I203_03166 [Kwoniella mangroviensis CBS 8507]OCF67471.1 hypothetical protein I203_03166 [Kwoniella mangroviensis CBS 8507]OCF72717.1 hypothetical protein I204_05944 [Kwoniella mangroviensis CBS 8886]
MSGVDSDSEQEYEELKVEKKIAFTVKRSTDTGDLQDIFKLSDQTPFNRLFKAYHDKYGIAQDTYRILYYERILHREETPKMLEMKIGRAYTLDAHLFQQGGK